MSGREPDATADHLPDADEPAAGDVEGAILAMRMRRAREACGMARTVVTEALGWAPVRLVQLESGARAPTLEEALALIRLYAHEGLRLLDQLGELEGALVPGRRRR